MPLPTLASADDLATMLEVDASNGKLLLALRRATDRFRAEVGRPLSMVTDDVVWVDGDGTQVLLLPSAPVVGTPTVLVAGTPVTDFYVSRNLGILKRTDSGCWPANQDIEVTYTHGLDEIPGDVADAVLEQAELQYRVIAGIAQMGLSGETITFGTQASIGVTQRWSDAVARYKLYRGDRS